MAAAVILWVLGDSWTDPRTYPWAASCGWPALLAQRLGLGLVTSGVGGSGYAATAGIPNFPMQAAQGWGAGAAAVIVWGSLNDPAQGRTPEEIRAGADTTYGLIRRLCPDAPLLVCGPQNGSDPATPARLAARDAVQAAAADADALFCDTLPWFIGRADLMLDASHPVPAGHALIADRLTPELLWALRAAPPERPLGVCDDGSGWVAPYTLGVPAGTVPDAPLLSQP